MIKNKSKKQKKRKRNMSNQSEMWPQLKVKHTKSKALPGANPRAAGWLPAWIAESSQAGGFSHRRLGGYQRGLRRLCVAMQRMPLSGKSMIGEQRFLSTTRGASQLAVWFQSEIMAIMILLLFFFPPLPGSPPIPPPPHLKGSSCISYRNKKMQL